MIHHLVWFHAITPLHNGGGTAFGFVDRPVIRDSTTNCPFVQGSTIKGALRAAARDWDDALRTIAFGPEEIGAGTGRQGALRFTDAELVCLPVRSLAGIFAWTTSQYRLSRLHFWLTHSGQIGTELGKAVTELLKELPSLEESAIGTTDCSSLQTSDSNGNKNIPYFILEGHILKSKQHEKASTQLGKLGKEIAEKLYAEKILQTSAENRFLVTPDEVFADLAARALPIEANIRISSTTGTTQKGSLRYTEYLPAETILCAYCGLDEGLAADKKNDILDAIKKLVGTAQCQGTHQIGADETTGKGLVRTWMTGHTETPAIRTTSGPEQY